MYTLKNRKMSKYRFKNSVVGALKWITTFVAYSRVVMCQGSRHRDLLQVAKILFFSYPTFFVTSPHQIDTFLTEGPADISHQTIFSPQELRYKSIAELI